MHAAAGSREKTNHSTDYRASFRVNYKGHSLRRGNQTVLLRICLTLWIKSGDEKPSEARYKIENDQYCSSWTGLWNEEDYGCFNIAHDEEQNIYYFLGDDFRAPFVINSGFELNFD